MNRHDLHTGLAVEMAEDYEIPAGRKTQFCAGLQGVVTGVWPRSGHYALVRFPKMRPYWIPFSYLTFACPLEKIARI